MPVANVCVENLFVTPFAGNERVTVRKTPRLWKGAVDRRSAGQIQKARCRTYPVRRGAAEDLFDPLMDHC